MPGKFPHVESLEIGHGLVVVVQLASSQQFVKDVFRLPCAGQRLFRVRHADDQGASVPAEIDARAGHDVRGRLAGDTAEQQHPVVHQMDAVAMGVFLHVKHASVNVGGNAARQFFNAGQSVPDDELRAVAGQVYLRGKKPAVRHRDAPFVLPGSLNAPLSHQHAAAVDLQAPVGLVPQEHGHVVRQVADERQGTPVAHGQVGGAVAVVRLVGAAHIDGGVDDVKAASGVNGQGILNIRLSLDHVIGDGDRAHVGNAVHG